MNKKLIFDCNNKSSITNSLQNLYDYVYTSQEDISNLENNNNDYIGMVIDCNSYKNNSDKFEAITKCCLNNNWHMVLLNANEEKMISENLGFSIPCDCMVVRNYQHYRVFDILGNNDDSDMNTDECCIYNYNCSCNACPGCYTCMNNCMNCNTCSKCNSFYKNQNKNKYKIPYIQNDEIDLASTINELLLNDYIPPKNSLFSLRKTQVNSNSTPRASNGPSCIPADSKITDLPNQQYLLFYVNLKFSEKITANEPQVLGNATTLEISLIASYNPPYKYLHLRTLGSGLNPGDLVCNENCCRGWFQNSIDLTVTPDTNDLAIYSNEPQNINSVNFYETFSKFGVGVNIGLLPSFFPVYEISNKEITYIYDYTILNKTAGNVGKWTWNLTTTLNKISNIFESNIIRKPIVKPLPQLATSNLQPSIDIVWFTELTYDKTVHLDVNFVIQYLKASIEAKRLLGGRFYYREIINESLKSYGTVVTLDFSKVSA